MWACVYFFIHFWSVSVTCTSNMACDFTRLYNYDWLATWPTFPSTHHMKFGVTDFTGLYTSSLFVAGKQFFAFVFFILCYTHTHTHSYIYIYIYIYICIFKSRRQLGVPVSLSLSLSLSSARAIHPYHLSLLVSLLGPHWAEV